MVLIHYVFHGSQDTDSFSLGKDPLGRKEPWQFGFTRRKIAILISLFAVAIVISDTIQL